MSVRLDLLGRIGKLPNRNPLKVCGNPTEVLEVCPTIEHSELYRTLGGSELETGSQKNPRGFSKNQMLRFILAPNLDGTAPNA